MLKEYDFSKARKNPYAAKLSKKITIRLDEDSIGFFKEISEQLGILNFQVTSMDWLALSKDGNRRARLTPSGIVNWLVP